jgi:hypothetical protein
MSTLRPQGPGLVIGFLFVPGSQEHYWNIFNSLRTDGNFCHQGWDTEIAQKI